MSSPPHQSNRLLANLPDAEYVRLSPHLELVKLKLGAVLYEAGDELRHAYFPTTAIVSLLYVMTDGDSAEIAVVGNDGMVGVSLFMGGITTNSRAVVQNAGEAFLLNSQALAAEFKRDGVLRNLLLRYTQALMTQMMQTGACNRHHSVDQQLCRWLLMSLDRLPDNQVMMTEGLIANMLGIRRAGVTDAAGLLVAGQMITYSKGTISVIDRSRLEQYACECYEVVKSEYARLLPD